MKFTRPLPTDAKVRSAAKAEREARYTVRPVTPPAPPVVEPPPARRRPEPITEPPKRIYALNKLEEAARRGPIGDREVETLARLWPGSSPEAAAARLCWQVAHRPDEGLRALAATDGPATQALEQALSPLQLALDDRAFARLMQVVEFDGDWVAEARLLRRCAALVCDGRDDEALRLLEGIEESSAHLDQARLLRALASQVAGRDAEAERHAEELPADGPARRAWAQLHEACRQVRGRPALAELTELVRSALWR
jgi:hypothetical protein